MITVLERKATRLETPFELELLWDRSRAYTVGYENYLKLTGNGTFDSPDDGNEEDLINSRYLIVDSFAEIEVFDRVTEVAAITRPRLLVILGIITYVTGEPLTPMVFSSGHSVVVDPKSANPKNNPRLIMNDEDYSVKLEELVAAMLAMNSDKLILIYSLLDRWRKACYLTNESEESFLYEDEAILAFFHILELLGNQFKDQLSSESDKYVHAFASSVLGDVYFIENKKTQADFERLINSTLNAYKTLKPRILRMLRELDMLDPKSRAMIDRFINHRNTVAHGRENLYESKTAIYPLKPFFNHVKDIYEDIDTIRVLTARAIAAFIGTTLWLDEWEFVVDEEVPVYEALQTFIKDQTYRSLSWKEMEVGDFQGVNVGTFINYFLRGKLATQPFTQSLTGYISNVELSKNNAMAVLYVASVIADSSTSDVALASQKKLVEILDNKLLEVYEVRDALKEMTYQGKEPRWLKNFLIERAKK